MSRGSINYLLYQVRDADDPMRTQEVATYIEALNCDASRIKVHDLLSGGPERQVLDQSDIVLIGGSGDYSAAGEGEWLERAMDSMRELYELKKPTFASCWGFQALARALGGMTIEDLDRAELGTSVVRLTEGGLADPVFSAAGSEFAVFQGHQDRVSGLPSGAIDLAKSEVSPFQAFTFSDRPIYATQFHPELSRHRYLERVKHYPQYVERITGQSYEEFESAVGEARESRGLLERFVEYVS